MAQGRIGFRLKRQIRDSVANEVVHKNIIIVLIRYVLGKNRSIL